MRGEEDDRVLFLILCVRNLFLLFFSSRGCGCGSGGGPAGGGSNLVESGSVKVGG